APGLHDVAAVHRHLPRHAGKRASREIPARGVLQTVGPVLVEVQDRERNEIGFSGFERRIAQPVVEEPGTGEVFRCSRSLARQRDFVIEGLRRMIGTPDEKSDCSGDNGYGNTDWAHISPLRTEPLERSPEPEVPAATRGATRGRSAPGRARLITPYAQHDFQGAGAFRWPVNQAVIRSSSSRWFAGLEIA